MKPLLSSLLVGFPALAQAFNLYATHYSGHLYTVQFEPDKQVIRVKNKQDDCGTAPSWLTLDRDSKTLYCLDESGSAADGTRGNLTTYSVAVDGTLAKQVQIETLPGAVHGTVYGNNKKFIALANYGSGAIQTFSLPLHESQDDLQSFLFGSADGASQPHAAYVDPVTKSFLWVPDLGADLIRVYSIDQETGRLVPCLDIPVDPGSGPRHAAFITGPGDRSTMYVVNEKSNTLSVFDVSYGKLDKRTADMVALSGKRYPPRLVRRNAPLFCPTVKRKEDITFDIKPGAKTNLAEIRAVDNRDLYVSLRGDKFFAHFDSIFHLSVGATGNESTGSNGPSAGLSAGATGRPTRSAWVPFATGTHMHPTSTKSFRETQSTGKSRPTESSATEPRATRTTDDTNPTPEKRADESNSSSNAPHGTAGSTSSGNDDPHKRPKPTGSFDDDFRTDGKLKINRYPSYGSIPRTFDISPDGRYLAIGNQFSASIAIVQRDPETGNLGGIVSLIHIPPKGSENSWNGISSVIWG